MNLGILVITFLGVNFDFFFMLLFLLKKYRVSQVIIGYLIGWGSISIILTRMDIRNIRSIAHLYGYP